MNLCFQALFAVYLLYVTRTLGVEPSVLGTILAAGSAAGVAGAALAGRLGARFGIGRTIAGGAILSAAASVAIPLADGPQPLLLGTLGVAQALLVFGLPIYNVNAVSLRQAIVPPDLLGRVAASMRFAVWGAMPLGAATGGLLGTAIGLRPTMLAASAGMLLVSLFVVGSPVVGLRTLPEPAAASERA
jgi:MFS family permease